MFTIGGTGVHLHKYLGTVDQADPTSTNRTEQNIQDLLFIENRDRKYDTSVYTMRGIYQRQDQDFDLSQFGLFLQTGTIFMTFHLRDMVDTIGRKIMAGDVLELPHLKDYDSQIGDVPAALKRYYVVGDCSFASEGFSQTWWPHLWRVKLNPLVDSQEYKDILNNIKEDTDNDGIEDTPIAEIISTYDKYIEINDSVIADAEASVPKSGYDTSGLYIKPLTEDGRLGTISSNTADDDTELNTTFVDTETADDAPLGPDKKIKGYLTGDGLAPNGLPLGIGIEFPGAPVNGDYFLRSDYLPNRLFRYDGRRWVKIEDAVRTDLTPGANNKTLRSGFVNDTTSFVDGQGQTQETLQSLSKALTPRADN